MNDELLNISQAAELLGRKHQAVRRLVASGVLPAHIEGKSYIFKRKDVERVKAERYPEGMTHSDIAREYDVKRTTAIEQFRRLHVKPDGVHRGLNHANVYTPTTVARFARILGWGRRHKSPTGESSPRAHASSGLDGEPSHDLPHADHDADNADNDAHTPSSAGTQAR